MLNITVLPYLYSFTKAMGVIMFFFYFLFVLVSLGFEYDVYDCPIKIAG